MKTIFRVAAFGLVTAAFLAVSAVSGFAQDPCADTYEVKQATYQKFKDGRLNTDRSPRTLEKAKVGITAGELFVSRYANCPDDKPVVDFINKNLPELKGWVEKKELIVRFDKSISDPKNINADEAYSAGKELIRITPNLNLDISIVLASLAFDNSIKIPPVDKYNDEGINFAKTALKELESGKTSENYGAWSKSCVVKTGTAVDHPKSKNCALGKMNYFIGSIMYYNQKKEKDALSYFYKSAQIESAVKNSPDIYQAIGGWYTKEIVRIDKERLAAIAANGGQDNEQTLAMLAMEKGLADRGMNALGKAHKFASEEFKKGIHEKLEGLYELRFNKKEGLEIYLATMTNQPLVDPSTPVTPIVEVPTTTTTTTSTTNPSTTPTTTKPATTTPTTTKPATTTPVNTKPSTTTTTKPAAKVNAIPKATVSKKKAIR